MTRTVWRVEAQSQGASYPNISYFQTGESAEAHLDELKGANQNWWRLCLIRRDSTGDLILWELQ